MALAEPVTITPPRRRLSIVLLALLATAMLHVATAATIRVTTVVDELDAIPNGTCSLREAVKTVRDGWVFGYGGCSVEGPDALWTNDTIIVPTGTYTLTRPPTLTESRGLWIPRPLRVVGAGAAATIIDGGGTHPIMTIDFSSVHLEGLTLQNSRGALTVSRANLTVTDAVIAGNSARQGGGLDIFSGNVVLRRSTISDNEASEHGGGIYNAGRLTIVDSTISGNRSSGTGGGIHSITQADLRADRSPTLIVINSTVSGNTATGAGGGIWHRGPMRLDSATITANSSGLHHTLRDANPDEEQALDKEGVQIVNTLLAGNLGHADCSGTLTSYAYNLVGNLDGCRVRVSSLSDQFGALDAPIAPLLGPLQANGGPTWTHALLPGSPAIDRGAFNLDEACRSTDQRGEPRPTDGVGNAIVRCDIGAYEAPTIPATADLRVTLTQTPNPVFPLGAMTTTIDIVNQGPARALGATYALTLPSGSPFPTELAPGCEPAGSSAYRCRIGDIPIGGTRTITTIVRAPRSLGNATTGVGVESDRDDPLGGNLASATTHVVAPPADLHVTLFPDEDPVGTEGAFWYTATVHNLNTRDDATDVEVRHVLSSGSLTRCESVSCTIGGTRAVVTLSTVAADTSVTYRLRATAPALPDEPTTLPDTLTHTMTATSANTAAAVATSDVTVLAAGADLGVELAASAEAVEAGSIIRYSLSGTNLGPSRTDATFTLEIPEGATFGNVSGTRGCDQQDARTITCNFADPLWPGSGGVLAHIDVTAPTQAGIAIATATIAGPLPDGQPNNDSASASVVVAPTPTTRADVMLSLVAPERVLPGEPLSYGIGVTNLGPAEAELVVVAFELPAGVVVLASSPDCASPDGTLTCQLSRLPFGDDHGFEVTIIAPDTLGPLTTTARVTTATDDPFAENDVASVLTEVVAELPGAEELVVLVEAGPRTLAAVTTESGAAPVPALQASFRTEATPLDLVALRLGREASSGSAGGTLRIYRDVDADATVGPDDVLLATHTFAASDVDLVIALDTPLGISADAGSVVLVTLEPAPRTATNTAPFAAAAGLLALVGLRRSRRRLLVASLLVALSLASCAGTPPPPIDTTTGTSTVRLQLVDAAFDAEGARLVGAPVLGPTITVHE